MTKNPEHIIQPMRFWQEVYIAAVASGNNIQYAKAAADKALLDFQIKTNMPYPQEGNE
jgi:hypothetical protein